MFCWLYKTHFIKKSHRFVQFNSFYQNSLDSHGSRNILSYKQHNMSAHIIISTAHMTVYTPSRFK